ATSASGPSRHIAPPYDLGRKRGIAEIDSSPSIAKGDARDPEPTFCNARLLAANFRPPAYELQTPSSNTITDCSLHFRRKCAQHNPKQNDGGCVTGRVIAVRHASLLHALATAGLFHPASSQLRTPRTPTTPCPSPSMISIIETRR